MHDGEKVPISAGPEVIAVLGLIAQPGRKSREEIATANRRTVADAPDTAKLTSVPT